MPKHQDALAEARARARADIRRFLGQLPPPTSKPAVRHDREIREAAFRAALHAMHRDGPVWRLTHMLTEEGDDA